MEMEKEVKILNLDDILPNRFQPRIKFNEIAILELAESIKEHGVIQPIVVRKISDKYEIIAGERRYKASVLAGKTTIPAIITTLDDKNSSEIALIENVQRQDLTPIEEAISYKKILDMGYLNQSELAEKLGKTQSTIANKIRLLNLSEEVQEALLEQRISERHARSLLKLNESQQEIMLDRIIKERLTVRKTDEEIKKMLESGTSTTLKEQMIDSPVEVLDLDFERKEEQKMNEELNIPTQQIIEPIEEIQPTSNTWNMEPQTNGVNQTPQIMDVKPISPIDISQPNTMDSGFTATTKMENNTQEMFTPQPPPTDLNMLLKSEPIPVEPEKTKLESPMAPEVPEVTPNDTGENPTSSGSGKFFNMFNFADMNSSVPEDLEEKKVNMDFEEPKVNDTFMFNFNPLNNPQPIVQEKPQTIPENETFSNVSAFNPVVEDFSQSVVQNEEIQSLSIPSSTPITPVVEESLVQDIQPIQSSQSISVENNNIESNAMSSSPLPTFTVEPQTIPSTINSLIEEKPVEPEFPPFNPYSLNDNNEFMQNNELDKYRIGADINSDSIIQTPKSTYTVADMRTVINTIRECAKTIENYGFKVDLDELDFADSYQVNFKISKEQ